MADGSVTIKISTHTLARRVTDTGRNPLAQALISTHTLARRVTFSASAALSKINYFNPHPRTEGDCSGNTVNYWNNDFNPHPRTEGDTRHRLQQFLVVISTHTLARRVTDRTMTMVKTGKISTHTLARRVTRGEQPALRAHLFQPTPSHGG